jgi:CRP/FNR family cyclic AMP-dependent transcriptional regulator
MTDLAIQPAVLLALPPFSALPDDERNLLVKRLPRRAYPARAAIVRDGPNDCGLHVLLSGKAKLTMTDSHGRQVTLTFLSPGDLLFKDTDVPTASNAVLTATATKACEVLYMPATEIAKCITAHPRAGLLLMAELALHLRRAYEKIASFAFDDVRARVAQALLDHATREGGTSTVAVGSEELARIVGASREMVSRVLKTMQTAGAVRRFGRRISIVDREGVLKQCVRGRLERPKLKRQAYLRSVAKGTPPLSNNSSR